MAEKIRYGMGQLRSNTILENYREDKNFQCQTIKIPITSSTEGRGPYYKDLYMRPPANDSSFSFENGLTYYIHLEIPRHASYECSYQIKLLPMATGSVLLNSSANYQLIKTITVPKSDAAHATDRVILFPLNKGTGKP